MTDETTPLINEVDSTDAPTITETVSDHDLLIQSLIEDVTRLERTITHLVEVLRVNIGTHAEAVIAILKGKA